MTDNLHRYFKIRWNEANTPIMKGHMHIDVWLWNYVNRLPKTRKFMMFDIRRRFKNRLVIK